MVYLSAYSQQSKYYPLNSDPTQANKTWQRMYREIYKLKRRAPEERKPHPTQSVFLMYLPCGSTTLGGGYKIRMDNKK